MAGWSGAEMNNKPPGSNWDSDDDNWDDSSGDNWSDWTDDLSSSTVDDVDQESVVRRREAARRAAEHDELDVPTQRRPAGTPRSTRPPAQRRVVEDRLARPARRGSGCLTGLIVLAIFAGLGLYAYKWVQNQIDPDKPGEAIEVSVPSGTSGSELGVLLHDKGVIGNANVWRAWTQLNPLAKFQAGKYNFTKNSSFKNVVAVLAKAPTVPQQQPLTIPPGLRITQIAEKVAALPGRSAQKFIDATKTGTVKSALMPNESAKNLEGFVVAETINFDLNDDENQILVKLVDEWDTVGRKSGIMTAQAKVNYSPYEVLIVASLIEREAKFDDERPKIARVIYNRLKAKMYLQLDATTVYDLGGGVATSADLKKDTPYNTYTNKGLPPTPIATPSIESIQAALAPTEGDWIYYVVTETDGRSSFANSFAEHKRNITKGKKNGVLK
jgi:UPF0755 protein